MCDVDGTDLTQIIRRLDRICAAVRLGFDAAASNPRPMLVQAMVGSLRDAIRLGHELTREVAYADFWVDLEVLLQQWTAIEGAGLQAQILDLDARALTHAATDMKRVLLAVDEAAAHIDAARMTLAARPGDAVARDEVATGIAQLESIADQAFMDGLAEDVLGRLDASMAVLTACSARAARERGSVRSGEGG